MKERISQLAKGEIFREKAEIQFVPLSLEETVPAGGIWRRELILSSRNQVKIRGLVYSTNPHVVLKNCQFSGFKGRLEYEVSAVRTEPGRQIAGAFQFISDSGEFEVPYCFLVEAEGVPGMTVPDTLDEFVKLAEQDFDRAQRIFASRTFTELPFMKNGRYRALYEGLCSSGQEDIALEEFLTGLDQKDAAIVRLADDRMEIPHPQEIVQSRLILERSCWGGLRMKLSADAPFIHLGAQTVTQRDFIGNRAQIPFEILPDKLHSGKNCGRIICSGPGGRLVYEIHILPEQGEETEGGEPLRSELLMVSRLFLDLQADVYDRMQTLGKLEEALERLEERGNESEIFRLLLAWIYLEQERPEAAEEQLMLAQDAVLDARVDQVESYAFYLYLRARFNQNEEQMATTARIIRKYYEEWGQTLPLLLLLAEADQELKENSSLLLAMMKDLYGCGCRSPFLYGRACRLLTEDTGLIRVMDNFELQCLLYGARKNLLNRETAGKAAALAAYEKHWRPGYFRLLDKLYLEYQGQEILSAACQMLIRAGKTSPGYFPWYQKAVEADLPVTSLYEYYLYALPEDWKEPLPQNVLLYFSYRHELDAQSREVLYENVLQHHRPDSSVYRAYRDQMERFALEQLLQGRISSRLAPLYKKIVQLDMVDERLAGVLPDLLFSRKITCRQEGMHRVLVRYPQLRTEFSGVLRGGSCCIPVYTEDAEILLEDDRGLVYCHVPYESEALLEEPALVKRCEELAPWNLMLALRRSGEMLRRPLGEKDLEQAFFLLGQAELHPAFAAELTEKVVHYCCMNQITSPALEDFLLAQDGQSLSRAGKGELVETLIQAGQSEAAYQLLKRYDEIQIREARLLALADALIRERAYQKDEEILKLCGSLYEKGQTNRSVLEYLCMYSCGRSTEMRRLLKTALESHAQTYELEERLLSQMLFSGEEDGLEEVYGCYRRNRPEADLLVQAYLAVQSHRYVTGKAQAQEEWIMEVEALSRAGDGFLADICHGALLSWYAGQPELSEDQEALCGRYLEELCRKGMILACYQNFAGRFALPDAIAGRVILQRQAEPGKRLFLRCRIGGSRNVWQEVAELPEVYPGIYARALILFADEELEYDVFQEEEGRERVLEAACSCRGIPAASGDESRFGRINRMAAASGRDQENLLRKQMIELEASDRLVGQLFPVLE